MATNNSYASPEAQAAADGYDVCHKCWHPKVKRNTGAIMLNGQPHPCECGRGDQKVFKYMGAEMTGAEIRDMEEEDDDVNGV